MTLGKDLEDLLKKYGINSTVVSASLGDGVLDVEIAVYDQDGKMMVVDNAFLTTYIEMPLNIKEPLVKSLEVHGA